MMREQDFRVTKDDINGVGFVVNEKTGLVVHSDSLVTLTTLPGGEIGRKFFAHKRAVSEISVPSKPVAFACNEYMWHWPFPYPIDLKGSVEDFKTLAIGMIKEEVHRTGGEATVGVGGAAELYVAFLPYVFEFYDLIVAKFTDSWEDFVWERRWMKAFGN